MGRVVTLTIPSAIFFTCATSSSGIVTPVNSQLFTSGLDSSWGYWQLTHSFLEKDGKKWGREFKITNPPAEQYTIRCIRNTRDMIAWLPTNWLARATWLLNQQKMWYGFRIVRLKLARESARRLQNVYGAQLRQYTDTFTPPTFSKLEVSERAPEISGYLTNGFIIRGNAVFGSVALLPRGFFNWKVRIDNRTCFLTSVICLHRSRWLEI